MLASHIPAFLVVWLTVGVLALVFAAVRVRSVAKRLADSRSVAHDHETVPEARNLVGSSR